MLRFRQLGALAITVLIAVLIAAWIGPVEDAAAQAKTYDAATVKRGEYLARAGSAFR